MLWLLYLDRCQWLLDRRLGEAKSQNGCYGEKKNLLPWPALKSDSIIIQPVA